MFIESKYIKWYYSIIENALKLNRIQYKRSHKKYTTYYETHHIIPKCMGGEDDKKNLVVLLPKEHYILHLLLCKMTTGSDKHKMINALIRMQFSKSHKQERYTSRSYSLIRKFIADKNSANFRGIPKSVETKHRISQARKGMKFSESHKRNISKAVRARKMVGEKNPFFGKTHTNELKRKIGKLSSERFKGNTISKGRIWITNGTVDKMIYPTKPIPSGFYKGRCKNRKVGDAAGSQTLYTS